MITTTNLVKYLLPHVIIVFFLVITFKIFSLSIFRYYSSVLLTMVTMNVHYIPKTYLSYN